MSNANNKQIIQPYLFFGGRCEEAINFYKKALSAEVGMLMRYRESPEPIPPGMLQAGFEEKVMHAELRIGGAVIMASDGCDDKSRFDGFRLSLSLPTEADAQRARPIGCGHARAHGRRGNLEKSGCRLALNASRPSAASSVA